MHSSNRQLSVFGIPTKDLVTKISPYPVHFYCTLSNGIMLMANQLQMELIGYDVIGKTLIDQFIAKRFSKRKSELYSSIIMIMKNNIVAMQNDQPYLFAESFGYEETKECLSIKARLLNSCNHMIGIGGLSFYPHQMTLKDTVALTKELFSLSSIGNRIKNNHISRMHILNKLSYRELECINYLARCMTYKEIASKLNISPRTVETHIENIKAKLNCYNRSDIVEIVFESKNTLVSK